MENQRRQFIRNLQERVAKVLARIADRAKPTARIAAGSLESYLVKGLGKALDLVNRLRARK
jgi:hypothetical protein